LAEKHPNVFAVIGVHPTYVEESGDDVITPLRELPQIRAWLRSAKRAGLSPLAEQGVGRPKSGEFPHQAITHAVAKALHIHRGRIEAGSTTALTNRNSQLFEQQLDLAVELD